MEILGNNLKKFFDIIDNSYETAEITYSNKGYEVWVVSNELHNKMCNMSENEFVELAGENAWWRSCKSSVLGVPDTRFIVNGEDLVGWNLNYNNKIRKYSNLSDHLCNCIGASTGKNVCACCVDLAKYNNMTMSELCQKYQLKLN